MDERDNQIISILQADGKATNRSIGEAINACEETVRRRRDRLLLNGDMRIVCVPSPSMLGYGTQALIGVSVDLAMADAVADQLSEIAEITWVAATTGAFDIFAWVVLQSTAELRQLLAERVGTIDGVQRTEAFVSLENRKERYGLKL